MLFEGGRALGGRPSSSVPWRVPAVVCPISVRFPHGMSDPSPLCPVSLVPVSLVPVSLVPVSLVPVSLVPVSLVPVSLVPVSLVPVSPSIP